MELTIAIIFAAMIVYHLGKISFRLERIERTMATQEELDAQIGALETAVTQENTDVLAAIAALQAKATPDMQPEIDRLTALITGVQGTDTAAVAATGTGG